MEEEFEKKRKRLKEEYPKLSPEERKKKIQESNKRKEKEYLESSPEVLLNEAGIGMTFNSILSGLMFTASVLFLSFGRDLLYGNIIATLTLIDTFFFVFGALLIRFDSMHVRRKEMYDAYQYHRLSFVFGTIGTFLMMAILPLMAFFIRWEMGVVVSLVLGLSFSYYGYEIYKHLIAFVLEID